MTTQETKPRSIADELRVIRKALRRIQAHENHAALKALDDVKRMAEESKLNRLPERPPLRWYRTERRIESGFD